MISFGSFRPLLCAVLSIAGISCEPGEERAPPAAGEVAKEEEPAPAKESGPPGVLSVVVTHEGESVPAPEKVNVDIDVDYCGGKVTTEDLIVDKETRGLKNVVVRLEKVRGPRKGPKRDVTVTNRNCAFDPHVQVAVKGSRLSIVNADPILHTTHSYLHERTVFNVPLTKNAPPYPPTPIRESGVMKVKCDVHRWMEGWVVIHDNGYIALTDDKGRLTIDQIPPGTYPYVAWHEKLGEQKGTVTIKSGETTDLKLRYPSK